MNPITMIGRYMNQINASPILRNVFEECKKGNYTEVENIARNVMRSQGRDFDKEFARFMNGQR